MKYDFAAVSYDVWETAPPRRSRVGGWLLFLVGILVVVPIIVFQDPLAGAIFGPIGPVLLAVGKLAKDLATRDDVE